MQYPDGMARRRSYGEGCAVAHGLDLVGERWTLLVVRELLLGPRRFNSLLAGIRQASATMLAQRLSDMEANGLVRRVRLGSPASTVAWELTEWGYALEPIVMSLGLWASRSPFLDQNGAFSPDALLLHLKARYDPETGPRPGHYEIRLDNEQYAITVADGTMQVVRGPARSPDAVIQTGTQVLTDIVKKRQAFDHAAATGQLTVTGDAAQLKALLGVG